jgi:septal ring-binding cell division protein DamX
MTAVKAERIRCTSFPDASFRFERHQSRNLRQAVTSESTTALALTAPVRDAEAYGEREATQRYRQTDHIKAFYRSDGYEGAKR